jgi:hypothetical protein
MVDLKQVFKEEMEEHFMDLEESAKTTLSTQISSRPPISTETKHVDSVKRLAPFSKTAGS